MRGKGRQMTTLRRYWPWYAMAGIAITAAVLGFIGLTKYFAIHGETRPFRDVAYFVLYLFVIESGETTGSIPWELALARWLAPIAPAWAIITAALLLFRERWQLLRLRCWRNHIVVCGLGRKGTWIAEQFHRERERVVAIEKDPDNPNIGKCRDLGIIVLLGDAADHGILQQAHAHQAANVIAITGNDGANVGVAVCLHRLIQGVRRPPVRPTMCHVHLVDVHLCELLRQHGIYSESDDLLDVHVFNVFENAARLLFAEHAFEGSPSPDEIRKQPHLIVVGFGQMGERVALQAAKTGHYAGNRHLHITVIDREARLRQTAFLGRYPHFASTCPVDFLEGDVDSAPVRDAIADISRNPDIHTTIVVCLDDAAQSLIVGLRLADRQEDTGTVVFVRMEEEERLSMLLDGAEARHGWLGRVRPFGLVGDTCDTELVIGKHLDRLARALHEGYVQERLDDGHSPEDPALRPWRRLAAIFRDSNRQQADHIPIKLRAIGCRIEPTASPNPRIETFHKDEIRIMAEMEHARWNAERLLIGWKRGPRDPEKKTSPCLVPWKDLPEKYRKYDREFVTKIPSVLSRIGQKVVRVQQHTVMPRKTTAPSTVTRRRRRG